jgi:integrase
VPDVTTRSVYTAQELAAIRRCSLDTVYRWVETGVVRALPRLPGAPLRFPASVVESMSEVADMGARYDSKRGQWCVDFYFHHPDGSRERVRLDSPVNSRQGATDYERKVRNEIASGTWKRTEPITLQAFAKEFLAWAKANRQPATHRDYESVCEQHLVPRWGRWKLAALGPGDVESYKADKLGAGLSKKTINNHLGCISKLMHLAVEWGKLRAVPPIHLYKIPKAADTEFRWLTRAEADKLTAAAWGYWRPMIVVALHTGLRMGELQALRWCDLDLKAGKLRVWQSWCQVSREAKVPKSGKPRDLPLPRAAVEALDGHVRRLGCELVFPTKNGTVIDKPDLVRGIARVCTAAGIEPIGWHALRHTYASWLVQAGVPLRRVQQLLGHSTIAMTERYAHLAPAVSGDVEAAFRGPNHGQQMGNDR